MILISRDEKISVSKKSFEYTYLHWRTINRFKMSKWHKPLLYEAGQRPLGPTILAEWEK